MRACASRCCPCLHALPGSWSLKLQTVRCELQFARKSTHHPFDCAIYTDTAAGDLDRRVADLVRDTGLTVVQFMSGSELHDTAVALTAADSNPNTKGMKAADAPFDAAADPVMAPLAAAAAAYAKAGPEGKAAAAETLRGALFRLLSSDYAAMGSSFGKDADKTLYVVDKKAMAPVFAYALSQLADGGDGGDAEVRELEEALADQALRGSRASARLSGSGSGLAKLGSEKALSNELAVKAGVAGQEIDKPSSGSDFAAAVEKLNGVYGKVNMGYGIVLAAAGNVGKLGGPAKPVADGVLAVTAKINAVKVYVDAVSTVMSTVVNVIHLAKADGLVGAEIFEVRRSLREDASCSMMLTLMAASFLRFRVHWPAPLRIHAPRRPRLALPCLAFLPFL